MTKSITEKDRLKRIKEHELNGTRLTPDLLKISLIYDSKRAKHRKSRFRPRLVNPSLVRSIYHDFFKEHIAELMLDIAKNIKMYDFKINIQVSSLKYLSRNAKKGVSLYISLSNFKNQHLGNLHCSENSMRILKNFNEVKTEDDVKNIMIEILSSLNNSMKLRLDLNPVRKYNVKMINDFINRFNNDNKKYKNLEKEIRKRNEHGEEYADNYDLNIIVDNDYNFCINYVSENGYKGTPVSGLNSYSDITYFKTVVQSIYPNLDIPDEYYVVDNIEEIKAMAKMAGY